MTVLNKAARVAARRMLRRKGETKCRVARLCAGVPRLRFRSLKVTGMAQDPWQRWTPVKPQECDCTERRAAKIRFGVSPQGLTKALELTEREREARGERRGRAPALTEAQAPSPRSSSAVHS